MTRGAQQTPKAGRKNTSPGAVSPKASSGCTTCKINLDKAKTKSIECDVCDAWFCLKCSKVKTAIFEEISEDESFLWTCPNCRNALPGIKKILVTLTQLQAKTSELEEKVKQLEKKCEGPPRNDIPTRPPPANEQKNIAEMVSEVITEQNERESRRLNIVCFGLSESTRDTGEGRSNEDESRIQKVVTEVMNLRDIEIKEPIRLGRYNPDARRPRPVRVTVENVDEKGRILERARVNVKNSSLDLCKDLYFQCDLTPKQRTEEYNRRVERRRRTEVTGAHASAGPNRDPPGTAPPSHGGVAFRN